MNKSDSIKEITKINGEIDELRDEFEKIKNPHITDLVKYIFSLSIKTSQAWLICQQMDIKK